MHNSTILDYVWVYGGLAAIVVLGIMASKLAVIAPTWGGALVIAGILLLPLVLMYIWGGIRAGEKEERNG